MNSDVIENNFSYHTPKGNQQDRYVMIRSQAKALAHTLHDLCPKHSRETALAFTKLEEAVMWANASIARNE